MLRPALAALCAVVVCVPLAHADVTIPAGGSIVLSSGSLDAGCTNISVAGTLANNAATVNSARNVTIQAGGTLDGGSSTITLAGDWSDSGTFTPGTSTVILADGCGVDPATISGNTTFNNLTITSTTGKTWQFAAGSTQRVQGTYTVQGVAGNPVRLTSTGSGSPPYLYALGPSSISYAVISGIGPFPAPGEWAITLAVSPASGGSLTCTPNPVTDGGSTTCTAIANSGFSFGRFSDNCVRTSGTTCTVPRVTGPTTVTALFDQNAPAYATLSVAKFGSGGGTVTSAPGGINCGPLPSCSGSFSLGSRLTLTATPFAGSEFVAWAGGCNGNVAACSLTLTASTAVAATFRYAGSAASYHLAQDLYIGYYGRPADPEGQAYWAGQADQAGGFNAVVNAFGSSAEFIRRYGNLDATAMVTRIYQQTLGRDPDAAGLAWYLAELQAGRQTFATIALAVLNGAVKPPDSTVITNKGEAADYYTAKVAAGCAYGIEQVGVDFLTPVTADPATVVAAKAAIDMATIDRLQPQLYIKNKSHFENGALVLDGDGDAEAGFIAQDVAAVIPTAVYRPADENKALWGLRYEQIIPYSVAAIQELKAENDALRSELQGLRTELAAIRALIAK